MQMEYSLSPLNRQDIDFEELERLLGIYRGIGGLENGGITRLAASREDGLARDTLVNWLRQEGAEVRVDAVGNIYGLFRLAQGSGSAAPLVMSGSHLDSQQNAGALDGMFGVVAACVAARALKRQKEQGQRFSSDFCVVNWTNEEGARFRPSVLGSSVYAGRCTADFALGVRDDDGVSLSSALAEIGYRGTDEAPAVPKAYVEIHIEQGPLLEENQCDVGVVTGNWAAIKYDVCFIGEQAHTGPYPMEKRKDALLAAAHTIVGVRELAGNAVTGPDVVHTSIGRIQVFPNSSNVVAARAQLSIELRSANLDVTAERARQLEQLLEDSAGRAGVTYDIEAKSVRASQALSESMVAVIDGAARDVGVKALRMETISGHDAISLVGQTEVGLVFVPSAKGISHNPREHTDAVHLQRGTQVLVETLRRLCI